MPQPDNLIDQTLSLNFGSHEIEINYAGQAHTIGDVWVRLRAGERDIIATGDFATLDHYAFFDTSEYGASVQGWIRAARELATTILETDSSLWWFSDKGDWWVSGGKR